MSSRKHVKLWRTWETPSPLVNQYYVYGWRAGSGLFFFWWTKNMLNLTGIGGPRHRHYFAWHYVIFSTSQSFRHNPMCQRLHAPLPFDLQVVRLYARTSAGGSSPWPHSPSPSTLQAPVQSHRIHMQRCHRQCPSPAPPSQPTERTRRRWPPDIWLLRPGRLMSIDLFHPLSLSFHLHCPFAQFFLPFSLSGPLWSYWRMLVRCKSMYVLATLSFYFNTESISSHVGRTNLQPIFEVLH